MSGKKINTWKDLNDNGVQICVRRSIIPDAHDKDDDMRNFVGGGKNSGMMTVNPKDKQVESIFQKAQNSFGAQNAEEVGELTLRFV